MRRQLREEAYEARLRGDWAAALRLEEQRLALRGGSHAYGTEVPDAGGKTLADLGLPHSLLLVYDLGFCNHVLLERCATRRMDDAAVQAYPELPCLANAERVPASAPVGAATFDAAFPALCRLACESGGGFTLGMLHDQCISHSAEVWTGQELVVRYNGSLDDARDLRRVLRTAERRCARARSRWAAGRVYAYNYDECGEVSFSDDSDDASDHDDDASGGGSGHLENEPPGVDEDDAERAAKRARHAVSEAAALPQPFNIEAAFPLVAELLTRLGSGVDKHSAARYWLFFQSGVLRLFRGAWRGPRGVLAAGRHKEPLWVSCHRYAAVHDALMELEAHLLVNTARGRALATAPFKAALRQAREEAKAARLQAAAARAAKAAERAQARAAREAAKAARKQARAAKAAPAGNEALPLPQAAAAEQV